MPLARLSGSRYLCSLCRDGLQPNISRHLRNANAQIAFSATFARQHTNSVDRPRCIAQFGTKTRKDLEKKPDADGYIIAGSRLGTPTWLSLP